MPQQIKSAASGERNATAGYLKQYEYTACLLWRQMQEGTLEGLSISDDDAGVFDDGVLHVQGGILAVQVKTEHDPQSVILATELNPETMKKMIASWRSIRDKHNPGHLTVKHVFGGYFSTNDRTLANENSSGPTHSAEFARFLKRSDLTEQIIDCSKWSKKIWDLQTASGTKRFEFVQFLNALDLCDAAELSRNKVDNFPPEDRVRIGAILDIWPKLVLATKAKQKIYWTESELIQGLGWHTKLSQKNLHEFPVPENFQANESTEQALIQTLKTVSQGYISLVGPPGTGKSTLLQRAIYATPEFAVARYLAFVPDNRHGLGRAEAGEFLNDIIAELSSQGIKSSRFASDDLLSLRSEFARILEQAGIRYLKTGRKTILVVDGLDHVPREENPIATFLAQLPAANAVPDGVIFLLGTQTVELKDLHATIPQQVAQTGRQIVIAPLSRPAIFKMANDANLSECVERGTLYDACAGHPLSARYFVEALKGVNAGAQAEAIMSHADGLGRTLEEIYARVWRKLDTSKESKSVLALLARIDADVSPQQLAEITSDDAVEECMASAAFLLSRSRSGRLSIFHNSFRLFVASETFKRFQSPDPALDQKYYSQLVTLASKAAPQDPQHWMQLRYSARAGDSAGVLALGSPDYFRRSLATFRAPAEVQNDLRLTFAAIKPTRDRVVLLNKLLISKEIDYRLDAISQLDLVGLLLDLGETELAVKYALETVVTGEGWLRLVDYLWSQGEKELSRQVFEANEPLEFLFGLGDNGAHDEYSKARGWIERAHRFRSIQPLAQIIAAIPSEDFQRYHHQSDNIHDDLLYSLARGILHDHPQTDIQSLVLQFSLSPEAKARLEIQVARRLATSGDRETCKILLISAASSPGSTGLHHSWLLSGADLAHQLEMPSIAVALFEKAGKPASTDDSRSYSAGGMDAACDEVAEFSRLSATLSLPFPEVTSNIRSPRRKLVTAADHHFRRLGEIKSAVEENKGKDFGLELKTILSFFMHGQAGPSDHSGFLFHASLGWVAEEVIGIAQKLGPERLKEIVDIIDTKIALGDNNLARSQNFRRRFALAVFNATGNASEALERIRAAQQLPRDDDTPHEVVEFQADFARAYREVGDLNEALKCLHAIHSDTFGYWLAAKKEPQYEFWIWAFEGACKAAPERAREFSAEFAQFILGMWETEGSNTAARLVEALLSGASMCPDMVASIMLRVTETSLSNWRELADCVLAGISASETALAGSALSTFTRLCVPYFAGSHHKCVNKSLSLLQGKDQTVLTLELLEAIRRRCPPTQRLQLLEAFQNSVSPEIEILGYLLEEARIERTILDRIDTGSTEPSVPLNKELKAGSLADLVEESDGVSDYGDGIDYTFARAAEKLILDANKEEIQAFFTARPHILGDAKVVAASGQRMKCLGDDVSAKSLLEKAETAAVSGYWSQFLGGQKLALQDLRIAIDGDQGKERGFDVLVDELVTGQTSGSSLFLNLDEILEKISIDLPFEKFWEETQSHLRAYREFRLAAPVIPSAEITSQADLLAFILAFSFDLSCSDLLEQARDAAMAVAQRSESEPIIRALFKLLGPQPNGKRERAALMYRMRHLTHLKRLLSQASADALKDPDFVVSDLGRRVSKFFGELGDGLPYTKLPAFYSIAGSGSQSAQDFAPPPALMTSPRQIWVDDPWTWTDVLGRLLKYVEDSCDFSLEVLRRRCAEFMRREGGREAFGPEVQDRVQGRLKRLDLMFPFHLPRPRAANRAFGMMLQELIRADAVDRRVMHLAWEEMGGPSLSGYDLQNDPKPIWFDLPSLPSRQYGGIERERWLAEAEDDLFCRSVEGHWVLGEKSVFRADFIRENASSKRLIMPSGLLLSKGLQGLPQLFSLDDLMPLYKEKGSKILCVVPSHPFGDLRDWTMTICPYVASALSWTRSAVRPFELYDRNGNLAVNTIRWVHGSGSQDPYNKEVFAAGQTVILSSSARRQLISLRGGIVTDVRVLREATQDSDKLARTVQTVSPTF